MLVMDNVHAGYGMTKVLHGLSLEVRDSEVLSVCGPNGAGKSTLLRVISRQLALRRGDVMWEHASLKQVSPSQVVRRGIALCPEGRRVFPRMTTEENLQIGAYARSDRSAVRREIEQFLDRWPVIARRRDSAAGLLSGGEQQILAIGRALMSRPKLLLLDEPSLGLAPVLIDQVYVALKELVEERDLSVLLVEQNVVKAMSLCDRVAVLNGGEITFSSSVTDTTPEAVGSHYFEKVAE
ncbi:ABC transporter ATP-binding protein [Leucobacter rhizosphaerae]|uniref:ABC transporter ATP-binding protein n=1 Tax=Leucobacter rhizosphaerae TaxID=2932245 RepID=A0ABY4FU47_9MICO|nr:ABC transporter ATP-binding protein [Leucobacter rhizosphaerae]UOQ59825.1 ABC transporter ATP-binding protein [Leucobacter rhizosphaerae]